MNRQVAARIGTQPEETENPDALIELHQVIKTFKNAAGEFTVLKGINVGFRESEFVSVVGRSGSGKSTLLNMITGIDHPSSGVVRVGETRLHTLSEGKMSVWRGRNMGIVFQFFQLLPMLTLLENVMLPMDFCDMYSPFEREDRALSLLREVDLTGFEHKYPAAVSGGQQQSAAVARAMANDPPILVADEPTGNLDTRTAELILEIFEGQVARGKTVIMVTHDNTLAQRAARRIVISDGELVNEWIAKALPDLPHSVLLSIHHEATERTLAPDQDYDPGNSLMIVARGQVDVVVPSKTGDTIIDTFLPGNAYARQFAAYETIERKGILSSLRSSRATVALRACSQGADVLLIEQEKLDALIDRSPELSEALSVNAQNRISPQNGPSKI